MTAKVRGILIRIVIVIGSILLLLGVLINLWMLRSADDLNVIDVSVNEGETQSVKFEGLNLVPGDSREYTIKFNGDRAKQFDLEIDFVEKEDKSLKHFAYVKIFSKGEVIYDKLLSEAFEDDPIALVVDFNGKENTELVFVYYIPEEVGNEAKGAEAIFEIQFVTTSEGGN